MSKVPCQRVDKYSDSQMVASKSTTIESTRRHRATPKTASGGSNQFIAWHLSHWMSAKGRKAPALQHRSHRHFRRAEKGGFITEVVCGLVQEEELGPQIERARERLEQQRRASAGGAESLRAHALSGFRCVVVA